MQYTPQELIKEINNLRKKNKDSWYTLTAIFNNNLIEIKGFGTWLQIFKINTYSYPFPMDISVKEFNNLLKKYILKE